ncbi:uncharacterized protein [Choristoneura fumiferana]|uniref:uncharacterized protein n=1 Tax=Choristoneura fumiferana TaxID=7141 RepID=UPI003D15463C
MAQHYYVALALCLFIMAAESRALKSKQISLPNGAIVMDIIVRQKTEGSEEATPIAKMKLEINGEDKKITLSDAADQMPPGKVVDVTEDEDFVPEIGNRSGIRVGRCPLGYVKRGTVCFPSK